MPANKKYLLKSKWVKGSKIFAALVGGAATTLILHIALAKMCNPDIVVLSSWFSMPLLWATIMVMIYWIKDHLKGWSLLALICSIGFLIIYFLK